MLANSENLAGGGFIEDVSFAKASELNRFGGKQLEYFLSPPSHGLLLETSGQGY